MEVDHEGMKRGASTTTPKPAEGTSDTVEHDPTAAPQIVDSTASASASAGASSTAKPVMGYQSGAVPDHYESYPEVVPQHEPIAPYGQTSSPYPQSATGYPPSSISPQSTTPYDRYQTISPPPAQQTQPLMQGQYHSGPIPVESEKKGYYAPAFGASQAASYGNLPPPGPQGFGGSNSGSSYGKAVQPPPAAPFQGNPEKKILGMRKKIFWIVLAVIIIVIIAAAGTAAGIIISNKNKKEDVKQPTPTNNRTTNNDDDDDNKNFTPYALTTGLRDMNLKFMDHQGSCNGPSVQDNSKLVNCFATSRYQVRISGSLSGGYYLSSVQVQGRTFSNIAGIPPTTDDPNQAGSAWLFEDAFTEGVGTICPISRITRYAFGAQDNVYAIGEVFTLSTACDSASGLTFSAGTSCTCVAISSAAG